jgi:hypothetical protein
MRKRVGIWAVASRSGIICFGGSVCASRKTSTNSGSMEPVSALILGQDAVGVAAAASILSVVTNDRSNAMTQQATIALWRCVETGELPAGARLVAA